MSKRIIAIVIALGILMFPIQALAKNNDAKEQKRQAKVEAKLAKKAAKETKKADKMIKKWIKLADKKINKNIKHLNKLIARTNQSALNEDQKAVIRTDINADITAMNDLKTKIHAGTDLAIVKADVKAIPTLGSLNSKYIPRINGATSVDD